MSEPRVLFLQKRLIGTCALVALILLVSFYSVVRGAVDRADRQRLVGAEAVTRITAPTNRQATPRGNALLASVGN